MTEPVTLAPAAVEAVARRVVELLADTPPAGRLVDATTLAGILGVSRATIYDRAAELGVIRIGDGPRGRLRFDPETALAAWQTRDREPALEPVPPTPRRRTSPRGPELLPIRGSSRMTRLPSPDPTSSLAGSVAQAGEATPNGVGPPGSRLPGRAANPLPTNPHRRTSPWLRSRRTTLSPPPSASS